MLRLGKFKDCWILTWLRSRRDYNNIIKKGVQYREGGIRLIPQGTIDNTLGPDRLEGAKALDPDDCRQPTLWLNDLCLEVLTVHGIELRLFWAKAFPIHSYDYCRASDIAAVGTKMIQFKVYLYHIWIDILQVCLKEEEFCPNGLNKVKLYWTMS